MWEGAKCPRVCEIQPPPHGGIGLALSAACDAGCKCSAGRLSTRDRGARKDRRRLGARWEAGRDGDRCRVGRTFRAMRCGGRGLALPVSLQRFEAVAVAGLLQEVTVSRGDKSLGKVFRVDFASPTRCAFSKSHAWPTVYEVHVRRSVSAGRGGGYRLRIGRLEPLEQLGLQVLQPDELRVQLEDPPRLQPNRCRIDATHQMY